MELDNAILLRCSSRMIEDIDTGIANLAKLPHLKPISRSSFARYAIGFALSHLTAELADMETAPDGKATAIQLN